MALTLLPITIPANSSMSSGVECSGGKLVRLITPSDWTSAAVLTFQLSPDGVKWNDLYHVDPKSLASYEVSVPNVVPNASVAFPSGTGASLPWVRIRSGTHATPVKQAADRLFQLVLESADVVEGPIGPTGPTGTVGTAGTAGAAGPTGARGPTGIYNPAGTVAADEAAPGTVGEVISGSNTTGIALASNTPVNLITLHLTPGDWNVGSVVTFTPANTGPNGLASGITLTSGTLPTEAEVATGKGIMNQNWSSSMTSNKPQSLPTSLVRVNTAVPKDVFLVVMASFGGGSVGATGYMSARRIR
jgi:hypothetical protein